MLTDCEDPWPPTIISIGVCVGWLAGYIAMIHKSFQVSMGRLACRFVATSSESVYSVIYPPDIPSWCYIYCKLADSQDPQSCRLIFCYDCLALVAHVGQYSAAAWSELHRANGFIIVIIIVVSYLQLTEEAFRVTVPTCQVFYGRLGFGEVLVRSSRLAPIETGTVSTAGVHTATVRPDKGVVFQSIHKLVEFGFDESITCSVVELIRVLRRAHKYYFVRFQELSHAITEQDPRAKYLSIHGDAFLSTSLTVVSERLRLVLALR